MYIRETFGIYLPYKGLSPDKQTYMAVNPIRSPEAIFLGPAFFPKAFQAGGNNLVTLR
jgi:hypothetical protein